MKVLLLDFEATALDTKTARILEVGALLVDENFDIPEDVDYGAISQLVWEPGYPAITPEVEKLTNISQKMLDEEGIPPRSAFIDLGRLVSECKPEMVIAYNTAYDFELFKAEMARHRMQEMEGIHSLLLIPWVCAMTDIEKNYEFKSWRLMHVALEYGVTVNPKELHRAIADVELMRKMLKASGATPGGMLEFQRVPWVVVQAKTRKPWEDGGKSNEAAKALGFRWERVPGSDRVFDKMWVKRVKENKVDELLNDHSVKIVRVT